MKRSDIQVGQELAHSTRQDWDQSTYAIEKVTVADTRGFYANRRYRDGRPEITLQDGTTAPGSLYTQDDSKAAVLVRRHNGDLQLVQLAHLRGSYAEVEARVIANVATQRRHEAAVNQARAVNRGRVTAAAEQLKALGVPVGYVSDYAEKIELGPAALEAIIALITKEA